MNRIMIIVWKWQIKEFESIKEVEGCDDFVISLKDEKRNNESANDFRKRIKGAIVELLKKYNGNQFLIFLHDVHDLKALITELSLEKVSVFGGGEEPIYFKESRNIGLLDGEGNFSSKVIPNEKIIKKYYKSTWDYYWNLCKRKLYELKEDLLFCLYPLCFQDKMDFTECLNLDSLLEIRIKDFIAEEGKTLTGDENEKMRDLEKARNNYYQFSDCRESYKQKGYVQYINLKETLKLIKENRSAKLLNLITTKFNQIFPDPSIETIPEFIRYQFDELLNSMDEPIY